MHREYTTLKFKRTYIGGSRKIENQAFAEAQGVQNDCSDCDWLRYRQLLIEYFEDKIHVIFSWLILTNVLSFIFLGLLILYFLHPLFIISFPLSIIFQLIHIYLKYRLKKRLGDYNYCITTVQDQIKRVLGFELNNY